MEIWEIESKIQELEIKLDYLTQKKENRHYQTYGTDVKYEYGERTVGSKSEIESVTAQIAQYKQELERKKANQQKREMQPKNEFSAIDVERQKKQEELQKKQELEQERLETFKMVKNAYKKRKGRSFEKFIDKLSGNGPRWKKVSEYTQEELEFVLKSLSGNTVYMNNRNQNETNVEKISTRNWNNFTRLLKKRYDLQEQMKIEERGLGL